MKRLTTPMRPASAREAGNAAPTEGWFRSVYADCMPGLFTFVVRLTSGNRPLAEEIVQETMLRAWRNAPALIAKPDLVRPWVFTVARRIVVDEHRKRSSRPTEIEAQLLEFVGDDDDIDSLLTSVVVTDALASLSEKHRAVIREVYFKGNNTDQAAKNLGIPRGTVLSRSYYALRALRLALAERGITDTTEH